MTEIVATLALQLDMKGFTPGAEKRLQSLERALNGIERASRLAAPALNQFTQALQGTLAPAQQLTAMLPTLSNAFKGQSQYASRYATSLTRVADAATKAAQGITSIPTNLPFGPKGGGGSSSGGGAATPKSPIGGYVGMSPGGLFAGVMLRDAGLGIAAVAMAAQAAVGVVGSLIDKFQEMGAAALESSKSLEGARAALTAVTGSNALAEAELKGVIETAQRFATPIKDAAEQYARLMAAAGDNQKLRDSAKQTFEAVMLSARAMNLGGEQVSGILTALEQIMSKGKLQAEELRKQLGNRLPGAFRIAAESMGMTTAELDKALKEGKINADKFFESFAQGLRKNFAGGVEAAMGSLTSLQTRLENVKTLLGAEVATQFLAPFEKAETLAMISGMENMLTQMQGSQDAMKNMAALGMVWGSMKAEVFNAGANFLQTMANAGVPVAALLERLSKPSEWLKFFSGVKMMEGIGGKEGPELLKRQEQLKAMAELMKEIGTAVAPAGPQLGKDWVLGAFTNQQLVDEAERRKKANEEKKKGLELTKEEQREIKRQTSFVEQLIAQYVRLSRAQGESDMFKVMSAKLDPARESFARTVVTMTDLARAERETEKALEKLDEKYVKFLDTASRPPEVTGLIEFDEVTARIWRRFSKKEDKALEDAFLALSRVPVGSEVWKKASEEIEKWQRSVDSAYAATRKFQETVVQELGRSLVDAAFNGKEAWADFGRATLRMLADLVVQLNIVMPLMEALKTGAGSGSTGWLSSLLSFGGNTIMGNAGPMSPAVRGPSIGAGQVNAPVTITINAAPGGGANTSIVAPGGETSLARDLEAVVLGVIDRHQRPGGRLWAGRNAR